MITIVHLDVSFTPSNGLARSSRLDKARVAGQPLHCVRSIDCAPGKETHMGDLTESPWFLTPASTPSLIDGSEVQTTELAAERTVVIRMTFDSLAPSFPGRKPSHSRVLDICSICTHNIVS
ncbi:hypothetical protein PG990_005879 [Apiospora arundinis]